MCHSELEFVEAIIARLLSGHITSDLLFLLSEIEIKRIKLLEAEALGDEACALFIEEQGIRLSQS